MRPDVVVRRVRAGDGPVLRRVRLAALAADPASFYSTLASEEAAAPAEWEADARTAGEGGSAATFLALRGGDAVGMAGGFAVRDRPGVFQVWGMWVAAEARGSGAGRALLEAVERWARDAGASTLQLWLTNASSAAARLYEAAGLRPDGAEEDVEGRPGLRLRLLVKELGGDGGG